MKRVNQENINSADYWNLQYKEEQFNAKVRFDDERRDFLYGAIKDWWQFFPYTTDAKILDVGCAEGQALRSVHVLFPLWRKFGIDISSIAINQAQASDSAFTYSIGSIYELPYVDDHFNVIHCGETLEHLEDPEKAIKEMVRVLRHKGNLVISVPFMHNNPSPEHLWEFTIEEALNMTSIYGEIRSVNVVAGALSIAWVTRINKGFD